MNRFAVECRAEVSGNKLAGYAALFGMMAKLPSNYETLAPTAFDAALKRGDDTKALLQHDPRYVLGSTKAGTLRLSTDSKGLQFEVDLPDTTYARDVRELVSRGDLSGMSFGFTPGDDRWSTAPDGRQLRTHVSVESLVDVSPVSNPAYDGTSVALRAIEFPTTYVDVRTQKILARHRAMTRSR